MTPSFFGDCRKLLWVFMHSALRRCSTFQCVSFYFLQLCLHVFSLPLSLFLSSFSLQCSVIGRYRCCWRLLPSSSLCAINIHSWPPPANPLADKRRSAHSLFSPPEGKAIQPFPFFFSRVFLYSPTGISVSRTLISSDNHRGSPLTVYQVTGN